MNTPSPTPPPARATAIQRNALINALTQAIRVQSEGEDEAGYTTESAYLRTLVDVVWDLKSGAQLEITE